jgi:hypothetical protein
VTTSEIAADTITAADIATDGVGSAEIAAGAVQSSELGAASVGAANLKGATAEAGTGVTVANGTSQEATVTCPPGTRLLGGGFEWGADTAGLTIIYSAPTFVGNPNTTWVVRGRNNSGVTNTIFAEALCLSV